MAVGKIYNFISCEYRMKDELFLKCAIGLGYSQEDLEPVTLQRVTLMSKKAVNGLSDIERNFYIQNKYKALLERHDKIVDRVRAEMNREKSEKQRKGFNPIIKKLLQDHEIAMQRKARYEEKVRISKTREAQSRYNSLAVDLGRTSPNFSQSQRGSRISSTSKNQRSVIKSENSRASSASSKSSTSHKDRLSIVKAKQREAHQYRKTQCLLNEAQSKRRIQKVHQSRLSLSRKIKTKSEIHHQAAKQKQQQIQTIQKDQIQDTLQRYKYKMIRNEYIKQKNMEKKQNQTTPFDTIYKRQLRYLMEQNQKSYHKSRYESKVESHQRYRQEKEREKYLQMQQKLKERKQKEEQILKYKQFKKESENQRKRQTLYYEMKDLQRARSQKQKLQEQKKLRFIQTKVKHEIVKSNLNSLEKKKAYETQNKLKLMEEKNRQINDIEAIKRKLTQERQRNISRKTDDSSRNLIF